MQYETHLWSDKIEPTCCWFDEQKLTPASGFPWRNQARWGAGCWTRTPATSLSLAPGFQQPRCFPSRKYHCFLFTAFPRSLNKALGQEQGDSVPWLFFFFFFEQEQMSSKHSRFFLQILSSALCGRVCLGTISLWKLDPHGKDIKIGLLPWYPQRWKGFSDFNNISEEREKEKASLERSTFSPAPNPSGVKSPSPLRVRCMGALSAGVFIRVFGGIRTTFRAYNTLLSSVLVFRFLYLLPKENHWEVCTDGRWHISESWTLT